MRDRSKTTIRASSVLLGGLLYIWLGRHIYLPTLDAPNTGYSWMLGPLSESLNDAAQERIRNAYEAINDHSLPPKERIRRHYDDLRTAERMLLESLRAQPAQAGAIAQLAAMRWEIDPPLTDEAIGRHTKLIDLASGMAPTIPAVQKQLAELLLKMGRRDEALAYYNNVVILEPAMAREIVAALRENMFPPQEILDGLPRHPHVITALQKAYREENETGGYIALAESVMEAAGDDVPGHLIKAYGDACLQAGAPARLRDRMNTMGPLDDPVVDAERLLQLSRALLASGHTLLAADAASAARRRRPDEPGIAGYHGHVLQAAGDEEGAIQAYRDALGLLARQSGDPEARARLYGKIGQAEESRGRVDRAYDAYKMALQLDPEEDHARRRLKEMEEAAGIE